MTLCIIKKYKQIKSIFSIPFYRIEIEDENHNLIIFRPTFTDSIMNATKQHQFINK